MESEITIPEGITEPVLAALDWLNSSEGRNFELTGLVDADSALGTPAGEPFEVGLVLCDGEICQRQQVRIAPNDSGGYEFARVAAGARAIPPLLDPPEKVRSDWLSSVLGKHEFVLLLFYRGLW